MATTYDLTDPEDMERYVSDILKRQQEERFAFEIKIEQHERLLLKYRKELYNENPDVPRLFQLQRIITQFIDLLTLVKYVRGSHDTHIEGRSRPLANFMEWKGRLSDEIISQYTTLLNSVSVRAMQKAQYPKVVSKSGDLTKEERIAASAPRGEQTGKKKRYAEYCEAHSLFMSVEGLKHVEAIDATAAKYAVHRDTIERALGERN